MESVAVDIIRSKHWLKRSKYRLREPVIILGYAAPAGFETDGATVPRFLSLIGAILILLAPAFGSDWWIWLGVGLALGVVWFPPDGRYFVAAVIHDRMLELHPGNRHVADTAFLDVMEELQIDVVRRWVMYALVWCWSEVVMRCNRKG